MTDTVVYCGSADVARWTGVTPAAVSNWVRRHPHTVPMPDVVITNEDQDRPTRGWLPSRRGEWEAFAASLKPGPPKRSAEVRNARTADSIMAKMRAGQITPEIAADLLHDLVGTHGEDNPS